MNELRQRLLELHRTLVEVERQGYERTRGRLSDGDFLKALIEEGVCVSEKDGRQVVYFVEDTTFSEPTERLAWSRKQ